MVEGLFGLRQNGVFYEERVFKVVFYGVLPLLHWALESRAEVGFGAFGLHARVGFGGRNMDIWVNQHQVFAPQIQRNIGKLVAFVVAKLCHRKCENESL